MWHFAILMWQGQEKQLKLVRTIILKLILFIVSWFMRRPNSATPGMTAMMLGWIGVVIALFASWLAVELVYRLNVGVDLGANLDAPNSLSGRSALGSPGRRSTRRAL